MPHYKDGTEAMIGDLIKGVGYNVKGPDKKPLVIVGTLIDVTPGATSCNVKVAHVITKNLGPDFKHADSGYYFQRFPIAGCLNGRNIAITPDMEYGQADQFELVHRPEAILPSA